MAGTAVPDWLAVTDRRLRLKVKNAEPAAAHPDYETAAIARGLLQHFRDDSRFHATRAFAETALELSAAIRPVLAADSGFRPSFLGHLLTEVLLDWTLAEDNPGPWRLTIGHWNRSIPGWCRKQSTACRSGLPIDWPP